MSEKRTPKQDSMANGIPLKTGIVYGPVRSRRLGRSLGLNVSPVSYKLCSFNCVYCQYGWTDVDALDTAAYEKDFPTVEDFARTLERVLVEQRNEGIDNITFSGNGEPTLHPRFADLVNVATALKERYCPAARLGVLSNSTAVAVENVRAALEKLDFKIMKLDAGDPETFQEINRPCPQVGYREILANLKTIRNVTLQTMFVDGAFCNIDDQQVAVWIERVGEIKPVKAQIYSLHRPSAASSLKEVPAEKLTKIAAGTEGQTGVEVEVIVAAAPYRPYFSQPGRR
jgi:wyosine [tRNA(Phe)-imidazoG37] synthetase (radical SAM superfamily)